MWDVPKIPEYEKPQYNTAQEELAAAGWKTIPHEGDICPSCAVGATPITWAIIYGVDS